MYDLRVLSLGAGVQSTALLLMALDGEFGGLRPDVAVFSDTQWEPKSVYRHLDWLKHEVGSRVPIVTVSKGNLKEHELTAKFGHVPFFVLNEDGTVSMGKRQCTNRWKVQEVAAEIRRQLGVTRVLRHKVQLWQGISADEALRMKDSRFRWMDNYYPLVDKGFTRRSCLIWLRRHGYPDPPKSSCVACPFHSNEVWERMKRESPEDFEEACLFDEAMRARGGKWANTYVHSSCKPLRKVSFSRNRGAANAQTNVLDYLSLPCEGMCGV